MEDPFDMIPIPFRAERLGRMRELIIQIEADFKTCKELKWKVDAGIGDDSDKEDLHRTSVWLRRNLTAYRKLDSMNIEGVICVRVGRFSDSCYRTI